MFRVFWNVLRRALVAILQKHDSWDDYALAHSPGRMRIMRGSHKYMAHFAHLLASLIQGNVP